MRLGSCLVAEKIKEKGGIKTKLKLSAGIMLTLLVVTVLFYAIPIGSGFTDPPIKVGVFGPMSWIQGQGMVEGATLAADKINAMGGIAGHEVILETATTHPDAGTDPTTAMGAAAAEELMGYDVDYVQGGFRTEAWFGAREVLMDNRMISLITGSATNELIDCVEGTCGTCVRCDYARYKYMFRNTPMNSTMLFYYIAGFLKFAMAARIMPIYTGYLTPLKIAVVSELPVWADVLHAYLSSEGFWNVVMGMSAYGGVSVVYETRIHPVDPAGVPAVIAAVQASDARVLIEVLAGPVGRAFAIEWATVECDAVLVGIDVPGQEIALHWTATGGLCETETFLCTAAGGDGPEEGCAINTVGPVKTKDFYRDYYNKYGHAPIYTSYGAFDSVMGMKEAIEQWVATYGDFTGPLYDDPDYDNLIPILEATNRHGVVGWFKYTEHHDMWTNPFVDAATWPTGYVRSLHGSWQAGRLECVFPVDQAYSKIWAIPSWMYPYPTDVNQDGKRTITDIAVVSYAIGSEPGDIRWQFVADKNDDDFIDGDDLTPVAYDYGQPIPVPLG